MEITMADGLFYDTLSANTGLNIYDDKSLVKVLGELSTAKKEYDKIAYALSEVNRKGYGIVFPSIDELTLEEPEIIKQGNKFGVRLKASAPSFHSTDVDIKTEVLTEIASKSLYRYKECLFTYSLYRFLYKGNKLNNIAYNTIDNITVS